MKNVTDFPHFPNFCDLLKKNGNTVFTDKLKLAFINYKYGSTDKNYS